MDRRLSTFLLTAMLSASVNAAPPNTTDGGAPWKHRMFGAGHAFVSGDLPRGRLRNRLDSMPSRARNRAMEWLHRFEFPAADAESLDVDEEGGVFYVDDNLPVPGDVQQAAGESDTPFASANAWAVDEPFALHSRPGAPNVVYLDFNGHSFTDTAWGAGTITARAFSLDSDRANFSEAERAAIAEIWHRVAEDMAAFDIDVTTEQPPAFGPNVGRVLITSRTDASGNPMPHDTAGGVAYVGVWGRSNYTYYSPALVYHDNLGNGTTYIAEASSHEFGHNLGLSHDGTSSEGYYTGHGSGATSWAPIMGVGYYQNVTQWSKGEYADANNTQDDLAIIENNLSSAADDHGDTLADASPLVIESDGSVQVSNPEADPHNVNPENKGVVENSGDVDVFGFSVPDGAIDLTINPAWDAFYRTDRRGANLDIQARLLNASGEVVATSDPGTDTYANIAANVDAGTYYLEVRGVGSNNYSNYGSAGEYFIGGMVPAGSVANQAPSAQFGYGCMDLACSFTDTSSDSDGTLVSREWRFGDGTTSTATNPSHSYDAAGSYAVELTVTDDDGETATVSQTVNVTAQVNNPPTAEFAFACDGLGCGFSDQSSDSDGSIASWQWSFGDGSSSTQQSPTHSFAAAGWYKVGLTVTDDSGATSTVTKVVTLSEPVGDTQDPEVTITSPADGATVSRRVRLSASATDNDQVSSVVIYVDGSARCSGTTSASCTWNLRRVAAGSHTISAQATDAAGNKATTSISVTVEAATGNGGGKSAGKSK